MHYLSDYEVSLKGLSYGYKVAFNFCQRTHVTKCNDTLAGLVNLEDGSC